VLDLGIDVAEHLFEDDIDAGAPFVSLGRGVAKIFAAMPADLDGGRFDGLDRTGVV
jgi:hypothetical protein